LCIIIKVLPLSAFVAIRLFSSIFFFMLLMSFFSCCSCFSLSQWVLQVMLPSACSFIVDVSLLHLVVAVLHCMFRPTWPSSGV
jgi:hypothetical protein